MKQKTIPDLKAAHASAVTKLNDAVRALAPQHVGGEREAYAAAVEGLMTAERELAHAEARPYAVRCDCPISWDVGAPLPTLLQSDQATFLFFLLPGDDENVGAVSFRGVSSTLFGAPNDETFSGHPLYGSGFEPYRPMRVVNSAWVSQLEKMNRVHRMHNPASYADKSHFIFPFHDTTFECVAREFVARTVHGRLPQAISEAIDSLY